MRIPSAAGRIGGAVAGIDWAWVTLPVGIAAAVLVLAVAPLPGRMAAMVAITSVCVSLWIGTPVPPWFTALIGIGLIGVAFSSELALVGFRSPATWLVVFGILIGAATQASGVASLVERWVLQRVPAEIADDPRGRFRYLLVGLSFAGLGFAVLIPSALVRVLVLGPILLSVGERFNDRKPRIGLFLGPLFATYYGAAGIFTGSLANIIVAGIVESAAGVTIGWAEWVIWLGPIMGVGRTLTIIAIAYVLYRPDVDATLGTPTEPSRSGNVSREERRMLLFLLLGVVIWATDNWHGLHPLFGALFVALAAFAPKVGAVDLDVASEADFSIVFFLGAIFAIAAGLRETGFTELAAQSLLEYVPADASLAVVLGFVVAVTLLLSLFMEGLAVASVLTPTLVSFAAEAGVAIRPVAMVEAVTLNTYFFPYQSAVLVAILGLEVVDTRELVRMATLASLATLLALLPLQIGLFVVFA